MFWSIPAPGIRLAALRCGLLLIAALSCLAGGETRFHQYTRQFAEPAAPARPVAAGYLGGSGDEVLSGGVFLADGSLVLAGTAWGPRFDPAGIQVAVLGSDGAAPSFTMPTVKAKDGSMAINPPDWSQRSGAGFLVRLGADHRSVVRAVRLPWGSGSITSVATDADGSVYVAGLCGSGFAAVGRAMALAAPGITDPDDIFVLRLDQDLRSVAWAVTLKDSAGAAPRVSVLDGGVVSVVGKNAFHLGTDGTLHKATAIALTKNWVRGVDSRTHAFATGGDSLTRTGWEPWRRPMLFLYDSAGR
ncbi:MAG: hypothetical protein RLZZ127_1728, partial [Planctomycetota bacterium]